MVRKIRVVLVDDERLARVRLKSLLVTHPEIEVVGEAGEVETAAALCAKMLPDAVFLDIQLPGASGFEVLPRLVGKPVIIVVTAHDRFAMRAFEVNALDYLLKPIHPDRLACSLRRLASAIPTAPSKEKELIVLRSDRWLSRVPLQSITHILSEPGIVIPFSTTIEQGLNFFGWPLAAGDHNFSQSTFATKIHSSGLVFKGYTGMDPYSIGTVGASGPASSGTNALSATPYAYLIPAGKDTMRTPPLGDTNTIRSWSVKDQALPLPKNLGGTSFSSGQFFTPEGSLSEQLWIVRKHQAFRAVDDPAYFYSTMPAEFTNSRLVGRSAWNTQWKIVIPAYSLLSDEQTGLDRFAQSVSDIKLFLRTYSNSGN